MKSSFNPWSLAASKRDHKMNRYLSEGRVNESFHTYNYQAEVINYHHLVYRVTGTKILNRRYSDNKTFLWLILSSALLAAPWKSNVYSRNVLVELIGNRNTIVGVEDKLSGHSVAFWFALISLPLCASVGQPGMWPCSLRSAPCKVQGYYDRNQPLGCPQKLFFHIFYQGNSNQTANSWREDKDGFSGISGTHLGSVSKSEFLLNTLSKSKAWFESHSQESKKE